MLLVVQAIGDLSLRYFNFIIGHFFKHFFSHVRHGSVFKTQILVARHGATVFLKKIKIKKIQKLHHLQLAERAILDLFGEKDDRIFIFFFINNF